MRDKFKVAPQYIDKVKQALKEKGRTHKDFAERLELSRTTVSKFLNGKAIKFDNFEDISEKLGFDWRDIIKKENQQDWGEAPEISKFYGRDEELNTLCQYRLEKKCKIIGIFGVSGIGKTALSIKFAQDVNEKFEYIIWRSLDNAPSIDEILVDLIQFFSEQQETYLPEEIDKKISLLYQYLRRKRCLVILDNVETVLQDCTLAGSYREDCQGYKQFVDKFIKTQHESCLILTSCEKPNGLQQSQVNNDKIYSLTLGGLKEDEALNFFSEKFTTSTTTDKLKKIINHYDGNPLILEQTPYYIEIILGRQNKLSDNIDKFLQFIDEGKLFFQHVDDALQRQFDRLSSLEKEIVTWLAINRESITLEEILNDLCSDIQELSLYEAIASLSQGRHLIIQTSGGYTLQRTIRDYVTRRLINNICQEITSGKLNCINKYAISKATSKVYIRNAQNRFIIQPIISEFLKTQKSPTKEDLKNSLKKIIEIIRNNYAQESKYGVGNVINIITSLKTELDEYNFSNLNVCQAYFKNISLNKVNFAYANLAKSIFTDIFSNILSVAFSPDGTLLATGDGNNEIHLWKVIDGTKVKTLQGHQDWVHSVAFSLDGRLLISGSGDRSVRIWEIETGKCINKLSVHTDRVKSVAFSPDNKTVVSASLDRTVIFWDLKTDTYKQIPAHEAKVLSISFSPDGQTLVSGSADKFIRIWDPQNYQSKKFAEQEHSVRSVSFSPDGQTIATSNNKNIKIWKLDNGKCLTTLNGHKELIRSVVFSPGGKYLASCSDDLTAKIWNLQTGKCIKTLSGHIYFIRSISFNSQGNIVATGSPDQTIRLWDTRTGKCLRIWQGYAHRMRSVRFSPDGLKIASASTDNKVRLWKVKTGECLKAFREDTIWSQSIRFSSNGKYLAVSSGDQKIKLIDIKTGQLIKKLEGHQGRVLQIAFHPQDKVLASSSDDKTIKLWDIESERPINSLEEHTERVRCVCFNSDGSILASGSEDCSIKLWNYSNKTCIRTLRDFPKNIKKVRSICFNQDDSRLASGNEDHTVYLWDVKTGQLLKVLRGHLDAVLSVAFSPKDNTLVSGSKDNTIKIWNIETGQCNRTLENHKNAVVSIDFSPDGKTIVSASRDETIRLWDIEKGDCLREFTVNKPYKGMNITGVKGLTDAQRETLKALGASEDI